jgi:MoaA/NifB/PqqE/SkfB family radical SAM enzyme
MSTISELPGQQTGSLASRLFDFARRVKRIDPRLARVFIPWVVRHPRYLQGFVKLARAHEQTMRVRARAKADGLEVPPFLVLSVTSKCNLRCAGCFAGNIGMVTGAPAQRGFELSDWRRVVDEAVALGVVAFVIAGGEPFLLPGIASLFQAHPDRLFLVFTNGTVLRPADYETLSHCPNTAVVVSVEGDRDLTDLRRGNGVFDKALASLDRLRDAGVLTGISVTVGPQNVDYWSQPENIDGLIAHSGPLVFFIEQIPSGPCVTSSLLTPEQRSRFRKTVVSYRDRSTGGAYIIHSPEDEEFFGGCVSAGRGFAHVNPDGDVTACPMSALATHNLKTSSLRQALASPFFEMIRNEGQLLDESEHPCGLSAHAGELERMAKGLGAYHTGAPKIDGQKPGSDGERNPRREIPQRILDYQE